MDEPVQQGVTLATAIIPSTMFLSLALVFIAYFWIKHRNQTKLMEILHSALANGSEITPALANLLEANSDLRRGVFSLARALACIVLGIAIQVSPARPEDAGETQAVMWILFGVSAFPGFFGLALLGFHFFEKR
ncbi:MAG: hypothetical protein ACFHXK_09175 [bacterium]